MNAIYISGLAMVAMLIAPHASAQISFYEHEEFAGRSFDTDKEVRNFERFGFDDSASSVVVLSGNWEICELTRFHGHCIALRPGRYPSLMAMSLDNDISSVRAIGPHERFKESHYAPVPLPVYDTHRRANERLYEANVTYVRAVIGPPEQRCWIEQERVAVDNKRKNNVPGAIVGAVLGGVLGHQVGNGRGNDIATVGGAAVGAAIGSKVGGNNAGQHEEVRDVQRCANEPGSAKTEYWDVTYKFRGQEHRVQTTNNPGATITVNRKGEPRT